MSCLWLPVLAIEIIGYIACSIAGHYRNNLWPAVPDWSQCQNADAGLRRRTNIKTNDAGLTFSPVFRYSGISCLHITQMKSKITENLKGEGTRSFLLHLYDNFYQQCSQLGQVTAKGLKNKWREWKFKKRFLGPLKINVFRNFQKLHNPNQLACLVCDFSKVI
jgi:hypothetical protein